MTPHRLGSTCLLLLVWQLCSPLCSKNCHGADLPPDMQRVVNAHEGEVSVAIKNLKTGELLVHRADTVMPTASLIKFPIMAEAYRQADAGELDLDQMITLQDDDKVPGSGILTTHFSPGAKLSLRDAIRLMMVYSDNTATNLVIQRVGIEAINERMKRLGLPETRLNAQVFRGSTTSVAPERTKLYGLGSTTAGETVQLYELLHAKKLASQTACEAMLDHLKRCDDKTKLGSRLPRGVTLAHKGGAVSQARTDGGLLLSGDNAIAICVLTSKNKDRSWDSDNRAHRLIGTLARMAVGHFKLVETTTASREIVLREGAHGEMVEALQRTLNERLKPSPELAVDGDFGPATRRAVERFETMNELPADGVVDQTFWRALGSLVAERPVAAPETVNSASLPFAGDETLHGPPHVTAKAWVLTRGDGRPLDGRNASKPLDMASTTKIMTAVLIADAAAADPSVLNEEIVFSTRADDTVGSTAGLRAGEMTTVGELLYGLLLPSGNDASVALAEHFGDRLSPAKKADEDPVARFVRAMNEKAKSLGMRETQFANPHGLTAPRHKASARDLAKLAAYAYDSPLIRKIVATRQHGVTVDSVSGYQRNVVWKNTNRLLTFPGYKGLKTGTTSAAGACLVSVAERHGERRILVTLGSASTAARYADSRNLHRWSWLQWPTTSEAHTR